MKFSELQNNLQQKSQKNGSSVKSTISFSNLEKQLKAQQEARQKQKQQEEQERKNILSQFKLPNAVDTIKQGGANPTQNIVNNYKKVQDSKTTIPSVNYDEAYVKKQKEQKVSPIENILLGSAKQKQRTGEKLSGRELMALANDEVRKIKQLDSASSEELEKIYKKVEDDYNVAKRNSILGKLTGKNSVDSNTLNNLKSKVDKFAYKYYSSLPNGSAMQAKNDYGFFDNGDDIHNYINNINNTRDRIKNEDNAVQTRFDKYDYMSDREIGIYNYLYNTKGKEEAEKFLNYIDDSLETMRVSDNLQSVKKFAEKHPVASAVLSVPANIASAGEQVINYGKYITTGDLKRNIAASGADILRGTLSEKVNWEIGNFDAFDFVYNTVMSGADSFVVSPLGSAGTVILGLNAAAHTTNDIIDRGGSNEQAFWGGVASGVFEGFFEKFSIGQLNKMQEGTVKGFKDYAKNLSKSMLTNASEETATEIANILYDYAANGGISQFAMLVKEYMANGDNEKTAKKKAAQKLGLQVIEAGASGALMGFGFASLSSASSYNEYKKSPEYQRVKINTQILNLVSKVKQGDFKANDKVYLESVKPQVAKKIQEITGIDVSDFKVAIEARQIENILKDHGVEGKADQSTSDDIDIAKMEYILSEPDDIRKSGKTRAYTYMKNGRNKTADTVLYEKVLDKNSYYIVQAVPDTKAKTLYVVTAFIGKSGYKKEASQLIDVNNPNATSENGSAIASVKATQTTDVNNLGATPNSETVNASNVSLDGVGDDLENRKSNGVSSDTSKETVTQAHDADTMSPRTTSDNALTSPVSNTNIPQNDTGVNNIISESGEDYAGNTSSHQNVKKIMLSNNNKERHHTTKAEQDFIKEICNALGREVVFEHIKPIASGIIPDGYIDENNVIHIGFTVTDPVKFVFKHELTHFGEGTEQYQNFIKAVESSKLFKKWIAEALENRVSETADLDLLISAYGGLIADSRNGDNTDWKAEMYADFVGNCLFNDNGSGLKALLDSVDAKQRPALIQYILDFLSYLKTKLSGDKTLTFEMVREISSLEDTFRKMLKEANTNEHTRLKEKTFSFARVKDNSIIAKAENMESEGAERDEIWHDLGVIRDSAGEWIYEISDKDIKFFPEGDALKELPSDLKEYYELANSGRMTAAKRNRFEELRKKYGGAFFRKGKLEDFLKHDELFEKFPRLRKTNLEFKLISTPAHYDPYTDTIVINATSLKREKGLKGIEKRLDDIAYEIGFEEDVVHEIEHALQEYEDRERGSSPEFWNRRLLRGERLPINPETNKEYTPFEAYMATKGEYEARESESRKYMDEEERRENVPDLGWGKTISVNEPVLAKNQGVSQLIDNKYISAVENADTETAQHLTDEAAKANGYTERLYHQTGAEFTEFNTKNQKAGKYDNELPTGTFLKPSDADIGLKGKKQMELYAKIENPLTFEDRQYAREFWKENIPGYAEADKKLQKIDSEYRFKTDEAMDNVRAYLKEWRQNNPDADSREIYQDKRYQELNDYEDSIVDEWEEKSNAASLKAKELIDNYISESGYDGVIIEKDQGSGGRYTKSYIVFSSNQLKDASPVTYDDNGNIIPLSERFNESKSDIRYSIPRNKVAITEDMTDSERYEALKNRKLSVAQAKEEVYGGVMNNHPGIFEKRLKKSAATKLLKKIGEEFGVFRNYNNSDVEVNFEFGKNNLSESVTKQKGNYDTYAKMLSCFSDVITNAVGIEVHNRNTEGYKKDITLKNVYVLCSAFDIGSDIIPVKLEIKEFTDKPNHLYVAVALESIKRDRVVSMGVPNNRSHVRTSPVTISIRDLFSKINTKDIDFIKYIPKEFLTEEQISDKNENDNKKFSIPNELRTSLRMYKEGKISYEEYQEVLDVLWDNALENMQDKDLVQRLQKELEDQKEITLNTAINSARYANQLKKRIKRQNEQLAKKRSEISAEITAQREERATRQKNIEHIRKTVSSIDKMFRTNSNTKHVPEDLKEAAAIFVKIFVDNDTSPFEKRDIRDIRTLYGDLVGDYNIFTGEGETSVSGFDPEVLQDLKMLEKRLNGKTLRDLNYHETLLIRNIVDNFAQIIKNENEMFIAGKQYEVDEIGHNALQELFAEKSKKENGLIKSFDSMIKYGNMTPIYFFDRIGGTFKTLFNDILKAQDKWYRNVENSKTYIRQMKEKYNYSKWDNDVFKFTSEKGDEIEITREQALLLYATARRENKNRFQRAEHLFRGGVVIPHSENTIKSILKKYADSSEKGISRITDAMTEEINSRAHRILPQDVVKIMQWLTEEQISYANALVEYLSKDMAALGNEVSLQLFGITKYNEDYYIPYNSAQNYLYSQPGVTNEARLKHQSFTKNTVVGANNPLVLSDFSEVCADHINRMCMYNALTVPLENMNKIFNYSTPSTNDNDARNVKVEIERVYGSSAVSYIKQFLLDMNGNVRTSGTDKAINRWISKFKKGAVFASASVVIQQPSAIMRAMAYINPKYFAKTTLKLSERDYQQASKYAAVAGIKEMGRFDTGVGASTTKWLLQETPKGLKNKAKAFVDLKDSTYRDDVLSWAAAKADEITWAHIWAATKAEISDTTDLKPGTEKFYEACGERFTEVINYTQVYDSTLSRSQLMRDKSPVAQMMTAFMSEPTVSLNVLMNAVHQAKTGGKKGKKFAGRAVGAFVASVVLNAALKSFVTAARDDDEDKTYIEKYIGEFYQNFVSDINPGKMIPFVRDVISSFEGYTVERADMNLFSDLAQSVKYLQSDNKTTLEKIESLSGSLAAFLGLPIKNILRDVRATYNVAMDFMNDLIDDNRDTDLAGIKFSVTDASNKEIYEKLVKAAENDDEEEYQRIYKHLIDNGKSESNIFSGVKDVYRDSKEVEKETNDYLKGLEGNKTFESLDQEDKEIIEKNISSKLATEKAIKSTTRNIEKFDLLYEAYRTDRNKYNKLRQELIDEGMTEGKINDGLEMARIAYMKTQGIDIHEYLLFKMATSKKYADEDNSGGVSKTEKTKAIRNLDSNNTNFFLNNYK